MRSRSILHSAEKGSVQDDNSPGFWVPELRKTVSKQSDGCGNQSGNVGRIGFGSRLPAEVAQRLAGDRSDGNGRALPAKGTQCRPPRRLGKMRCAGGTGEGRCVDSSRERRHEAVPAQSSAAHSGKHPPHRPLRRPSRSISGIRSRQPPPAPAGYAFRRARPSSFSTRLSATYDSGTRVTANPALRAAVPLRLQPPPPSTLNRALQLNAQLRRSLLKARTVFALVRISQS